MNKTRILHVLDYFFVFRPTLFFPIWTIALVGAFAGQRQVGDYSPVGILSTFIIFALYTLTFGAVYLINNIFDRENDAANGKVFLISDDFIPPAKAWSYLIILLIVIFLLAFLHSIWLFYWLLGIFLVSGVAYSVRPIALKDRAYGSLAINIASGFALFAFGWQLYAPFDGIHVWWHAVPYVLAWVATSILTTIPDSSGDAEDDKHTIAVELGHAKSQNIAYLLLLLALVFALLTWDWVILVSCLLAWPFYHRMWQTRSVAGTLRAIRWSISFLSFTMFFVFPLYFLACFIVFFLARWYYRERFDLNYPTWKVTPS